MREIEANKPKKKQKYDRRMRERKKEKEGEKEKSTVDNIYTNYIPNTLTHSHLA